MLGSLYDAFWDERFWFPSNRSHGWHSLVNTPGSATYYPQLRDLNWALILGFVLIGVRYLLDVYVMFFLQFYLAYILAFCIGLFNIHLTK